MSEHDPYKWITRDRHRRLFREFAAIAESRWRDSYRICLPMRTEYEGHFCIEVNVKDGEIKRPVQIVFPADYPNELPLVLIFRKDEIDCSFRDHDMNLQAGGWNVIRAAEIGLVSNPDFNMVVMLNEIEHWLNDEVTSLHSAHEEFLTQDMLDRLIEQLGSTTNGDAERED